MSKTDTVFYLVGLLLRDRTHGASVSAAAAIQAGVGIDLVLGSTLGDSAHGAGISAGTAADASVTDLVSHWYVHLQVKCIPILPHLLKNAMANLNSLSMFCLSTAYAFLLALCRPACKDKARSLFYDHRVFFRPLVFLYNENHAIVAWFKKA